MINIYFNVELFCKNFVTIFLIQTACFAGKEKLNIAQNESVRLVLEADGTQIEDPEYFKTLSNNTTVLLLRNDEYWYPAGVDAIKTGYYELHNVLLLFILY